MWTELGDDEPGCGRATRFARALLFSRGYTAFVVLQVLLNLALFIWEVATVAGFSLPNHVVFFILEVWVNVSLILEVVLRLVAAGSLRRFFRDKGHWFDVIVLIFSLTALVLLLSAKGWLETLASEATLVLLAVRYVVVLLRVALLLKAQGRTLATTFTERIEFVSAAPPSDDASHVKLHAARAESARSPPARYQEEDEEELDDQDQRRGAGPQNSGRPPEFDF